MKKLRLGLSIFIGLSFFHISAFADRGDLFLTVAPLVQPASKEILAGGELGLSLGANEQTDFQFEVDWASQAGYFDDNGVMETRYLVGSFFTPYFGEIRPRFGLSGGLVHSMGSGGVNQILFDVGAHLQGLWDVSQSYRFFAEVNPNIYLGETSGFTTLFKLGIQFRLSK